MKKVFSYRLKHVFYCSLKQFKTNLPVLLMPSGFWLKRSFLGKPLLSAQNFSFERQNFLGKSRNYSKVNHKCAKLVDSVI